MFRQISPAHGRHWDRGGVSRERWFLRIEVNKSKKVEELIK